MRRKKTLKRKKSRSQRLKLYRTMLCYENFRLSALHRAVPGSGSPWLVPGLWPRLLPGAASRGGRGWPRQTPGSEDRGCRGWPRLKGQGKKAGGDPGWTPETLCPSQSFNPGASQGQPRHLLSFDPGVCQGQSRPPGVSPCTWPRYGSSLVAFHPGAELSLPMRNVWNIVLYLYVVNTVNMHKHCNIVGILLI